jgi:Tol biopolymer transport system component
MGPFVFAPTHRSIANRTVATSTGVTAYPSEVHQRRRWASTATGCLVLALATVTTGEPGSAATERRPSGLIAFGRETPKGALLQVVTSRGKVRTVAGGAITDFAWSPDGSGMVFSRVQGNHDLQAPEDLFFVDGFNRDQVPFITRNDETTTRDTQPNWAHDGSPIAFVRTKDQIASIYLVGSDGTRRRSLTSPPIVDGIQARDLLPQWSPDGTKVAFVRDVAGVRNLFVIDRDGTDEVALTSSGFEGLGYSWSPDGGRLAFVEGDTTAGDLFTIKSDGSDKVQVTNDQLPKFQPVWAPSGKRIVFSQGTSPEFDLFVIALKDGRTEQLTDTPGREISPTWSPDSRFIAYEAFAPGFTDTANPKQEPGSLNIVSIRSKAVSTLTEGKLFVFPIAWQPEGDSSAGGLQDG